MDSETVKEGNEIAKPLKNKALTVLGITSIVVAAVLAATAVVIVAVRLVPLDFSFEGEPGEDPMMEASIVSLILLLFAIAFYYDSLLTFAFSVLPIVLCLASVAVGVVLLKDRDPVDLKESLVCSLIVSVQACLFCALYVPVRYIIMPMHLIALPPRAIGALVAEIVVVALAFSAAAATVVISAIILQKTRNAVETISSQTPEPARA